MKKICVFCSSSSALEECYHKDAQKLGELIAKAGMDFIYGGSTLGLMGKSAAGAKKFGAKVTGIMPQRLCDLGISSGNCDNFYMTKGMRERKAKIDEMSDAVVALPGGFGTLEEISEIIVQKQLGYNDKPIVFLNTNRFYDKLIEFFDLFIDKKFAKPNAKNAYFVANTPEEAIDYIVNYVPSEKIAEENYYVK